MDLLEIRDLTKNFGGLTAINQLNFSIREGEIIGLIGPNGAGKSTLFDLITGFLHPTRGRTWFQGKEITGLSNYSIARLGISRTFQQTRILTNDSVWDNLTIGSLARTKHSIWSAFIPGLRKKGSDYNFIQKNCLHILELLGMKGYAQNIAGNLDAEKQKRLSIGIALANEPKLLLLDEPTGGVNIEEIEELKTVVKYISRLGITICLIEHKMSLVMEICQRIIVLNHGEKIAEGTPSEVANNDEVIKAYLGDEYVAKYK